MMHAGDIDGAMDDARDGSERHTERWMMHAMDQADIDGAKDDARERHRRSNRG